MPATPAYQSEGGRPNSFQISWPCSRSLEKYVTRSQNGEFVNLLTLRSLVLRPSPFSISRNYSGNRPQLLAYRDQAVARSNHRTLSLVKVEPSGFVGGPLNGG